MSERPLRTQLPAFTVAQWIAVFVPPILTATMYLAFTRLVSTYGFERGFLLAFAIYWIGWCLVLPSVLFGPRTVLGVFRETTPRFGSRRNLTLALLLWPLPFAFAFAFLPRIGGVGPRVILASIVVGIVIGVTEETLWRGLYVDLFDDWLFGVLYPGIWFGLWHFAPQAVRTDGFPGAPYSFVFYATVLGLSYGYYARETGSIRWATVSHVVHDSLGLAGGTFLTAAALLV